MKLIKFEDNLFQIIKVIHINKGPCNSNIVKEVNNLSRKRFSCNTLYHRLQEYFDPKGNLKEPLFILYIIFFIVYKEVKIQSRIIGNNLKVFKEYSFNPTLSDVYVTLNKSPVISNILIF